MITPSIPAPSDAPAATVNTTTGVSSGAPAELAPPTKTVDEAVSDATKEGRSPLQRLLALIPVDKQADAYSVIEELMVDVREKGAPRDPTRKLTMKLGRGTRFRNERQPDSDAGHADRAVSDFKG